MEKILDKFLRYVAVETTSNDASDTQPSSECQLNLLRMLADELNAMGVKATLDEWGYVMATIPSNIEKEVPAVGFIAHVDTAPDASGKDIKPQIIENYDGGDIRLGQSERVLSTAVFPHLTALKGRTLITTDGSIGEIKRDSYVEAEERIVRELKSLGKPFAIILNSANPDSEQAHSLAHELEEKYGRKFTKYLYDVLLILQPPLNVVLQENLHLL